MDFGRFWSILVNVAGLWWIVDWLLWILEDLDGLWWTLLYRDWLMDVGLLLMDFGGFWWIFDGFWWIFDGFWWGWLTDDHWWKLFYGCAFLKWILMCLWWTCWCGIWWMLLCSNHFCNHKRRYPAGQEIFLYSWKVQVTVLWQNQWNILQYPLYVTQTCIACVWFLLSRIYLSIDQHNCQHEWNIWNVYMYINYITLLYVTLHYIIIHINMVEYGYHVCTILMWCFVNK